MVSTRVVTNEELLQLPRDGRKYELVDGEIVVSPAGYRHGRTIVRLTVLLANHVQAHKLGDVLDSSTGFRLPGKNVRSPDVSFVVAERCPRPEPVGFVEIPPDLAVEVLSGDDARKILDKVGEYLKAGVRLVWVIDPEKRKAVVYRSLMDVHEVAEDGSLSGEDVVPGFSCRLSEILE
jgi:Uma2 family endonuclease